MQIRWSPDAAQDLEEIVYYIRVDDPGAARRVAQRIYESAEGLVNFPNRGRAGRVRGTRELPLPPLPFIIIYRVIEIVDAIEIVNVIHGAQRWPRAN